MSQQPPHRDPKQLRASDADRERVAQVLHKALGEGRITLDELQERLDQVYSAKTLGELEPVVADLPTDGSHLPIAPVVAASSVPDRRVGGTPGSTTSIAVMSGTERKGAWVLPPQHNSFAFWGGVEIDLRHARFAEQYSTITAVAIMGGVDVIVPDDVAVEVTGVGIMGAFETRNKKGASPTAPPGAPVVKVTGLAFWGGVEVKRVPRSKIDEIE
ncbi:DUF1707 SHOCT-like domain-containing protein [Saccharomonospora xinjiangensis]|uniref:Uncharacterized protein n=1 Tax=Saccharomonospora xinjiangensis XJ-54 TaxID=882086 RepID=I0V0P1_9PSEU|nr:DUF1707 domain-containing protein [Saccharomonospora xinjiangensis]EID53694.1 protein of unknown function (DUF1707)/predicted membrane protein (DUF2154) [Saccharomonospora xinjiangensis XJ-54]